jgi:hypothetical protein
MFAGYHRATLNRGPEWARICAEVVKLKISRRSQERGEVIPLQLAAGAESSPAGGGGGGGGGTGGALAAGGAAGVSGGAGGAIVELTAGGVLETLGMGGAIVELTDAAGAGLRNSGRYSSAKLQGSHAKNFAEALRNCARHGGVSPGALAVDVRASLGVGPLPASATHRPRSQRRSSAGLTLRYFAGCCAGLWQSHSAVDAVLTAREAGIDALAASCRGDEVAVE